MKRWWRRWWPRRTIRPTRDGWWALLAALGIGFAAMNTGNNLLYLLVSLLLALIVVSGGLSERSLRGLRLTPVVPEEVQAGRPALFGVRVRNRKRRPSYSISIQVEDVERAVYLPRLDPGDERLVTWEATPPRRGVQAFPDIRIVTRFPFGLFTKSMVVEIDATFLVFPHVGPVPPERRQELAGAGRAAHRRRGRGHDLYNLRDYRPGDDPRLIHWRSSAKRPDTLVVRELTAESAVDTRLTLEGTGADAERLERGLSEAASLAAFLLRGGGAVELVAPGLVVELGRGREQRRRLLSALALYAPGGAGRSIPVPARPARDALRQVRIALG